MMTISRARWAASALGPGLALLSTTAGCSPSAAPAPPAATWQLLASELPGALLSVSARSPSDVFAVGADKGRGPAVLHFDGTRWASLKTGQTGDLWWTQALPDGTTLMAGTGGMVLRYDGQRFERVNTPGLGRQTVYGVWGATSSDFYAVGSSAGRDGFVWHYHDGAVENERIPVDVPRTPGGEVPGFFKVFGTGSGAAADVWVVGGSGAVLHRRGSGPLLTVPSPTKETLFTVNGAGGRLLMVGGAGNGALLEIVDGRFSDLAPAGAGLLQGVFSSPKGDWASGERGMVYMRGPLHTGARDAGASAFAAVDHGLTLAPTTSLHAITVDSGGGVWSVGGNVLTPALDGGVLIHYGASVPQVAFDDEPAADAGPAVATCPAAVIAAGKQGSIARRWNEQALAAIRRDLPRPTVHARNLFHVSAAMWDAWAAYDERAAGVFVRERHRARDPASERSKAISFAAYRILAHRYRRAVGGSVTLACLRGVMQDLGYDADDVHDAGDDAIALGNRIGSAVLTSTANDGANEDTDYEPPPTYALQNAPLVFDGPGAHLTRPAQWQPLNLSVAATQNGIVLPGGTQHYIGAEWGRVTPFAMRRSSDAAFFYDPGPAPDLGPAMKDWLLEVVRKTAASDPADDATIDISPGAFGHNSLGANDGHGWSVNPVTGKPYAPEVVRLSDFARVMAEFWADGPKSETPPGHWNAIANAVADAPAASHRLFGKGERLDPLAWDVHVYLALNGAEHDAAIAAWDIKRRFMTVRPISLIRWMAGKGQSSDASAPSYDPDGLPLAPGLIEVITPESSKPGQRHAHLACHVGEIAVRDWLGEPGNRTGQVAGVGWVRGVDWTTYQRRTFVTPAFPGFISGHSTFSRAGAEVLGAVTGSPYFPEGLGEFVALKDTFLSFERGPSTDVRLQWASYFDASDEAGQSRIWGGIHIQPDDFAGRRVGRRVGLGAVALASRYFEGRI